MDFMDSFAGRRVPRAVTDAGLALLFTAGAFAPLGPMPPEAPVLRTPDALFAVLALLSALPLAVHRRFPLPVLLVMTAAAAALQGRHFIPQLSGPQGTSIGPAYIGVATAVLLTALRGTPRTATLVVAVVIPAAAVTEAVLAAAGHRLATFLTEAVLLVAAWALGRLTRARSAIRDQALERAAALERAQAANARAAVMEERARIARELHDIVAHNVSLMVVQTIAADRVQDRDGDKAHELHGTIEETGRATVTELRRLLDVLRTEDEADSDPNKEPPQPTVEAVPALLDAVRATGLTIDCSTTGTPVELPAGSHLTVYRVVQEALTNTLKHAGRTRTGLTVAWEPEHRRLAVRICDDGPRPDGEPAARPPAPADGRGHGLVGMRERVLAVGGSLYTGPRPGGGYCVHAVVPLPRSPAVPHDDPLHHDPPHHDPPHHDSHDLRHEGHPPYARDPRPAGR
ncbi:signal transduction histidine kinase [Streptomyces sp. V3I8]|uniref:sensor histidine kinase n=1 Tax=Streptomyces sp. V3I8 TaxID=3042279 RepID=UPI002780BF5C|nr:histidine kinase [Streptomyces sp. V3I8]MDQ1035016.1 signal transduction histidine kinase [Streptomyces sp. V3I8]